jgi:DNA-binding transcriptional regulator YiaG
MSDAPIRRDTVVPKEGTNDMDAREIQALRTELGISAGDLATFIGVAPATFRRYETVGGPEPSGVQLVLLEAIQEGAKIDRQRVKGAVLEAASDHRYALYLVLSTACTQRFMQEMLEKSQRLSQSTARMFGTLTDKEQRVLRARFPDLDKD